MGGEAVPSAVKIHAGARVNVPGQAAGNWRWRFTEDMLTPSTFRQLADLTRASNRFAAHTAGTIPLEETEVTR
jgi:4-alpha-glucanotransferase